MPLDPNSQFDQTVLEMIEHSPIGAVPMTPAYQDALKRLYAAHQIYASADHKGGHVTARSLATAPSFHANNLDAVFAGQISADELESNASIFDRYLGSLPAGRRAKAETYRLQVAGRPAHHRAKHTAVGDAVTVHDPVHTLFLVPGTGPHHGLPGNYLYGSALQVNSSADSKWLLQLHDCDDGACVCDAATVNDALKLLQDVVASAPFTMDELDALGFKMT